MVKRKCLSVLLAILMIVTLLPAAVLADEGGGCEDGEHLYEVNEILEPTCVKAGRKVYVCSVCGESYTEEIEPLGHDFSGGQIVRRPTEDAEGEAALICTRCDTVKSVPILEVPEEGEVDAINLTWNTQNPALSWWGGPNDCHYRLVVISEGGAFRVYETDRNTYQDVTEFVNAYPGSCYAVVEGYDADEYRVAYGRSDDVRFSQVAVTVHNLDEDGTELSWGSGWYSFEIDGGYAGGGSGDGTFYMPGGMVRINVSPSTGFELTSLTVNGVELTETPYEFLLENDTAIEMTYQKNSERALVTVEAGDGHEDFAEMLCEYLNANDSENDAVQTGSTVEFKALKAQTVDGPFSQVSSCIHMNEQQFADADQSPMGAAFSPSYSSRNEWEDENRQKMQDPMPENLTLYVIWKTNIHELDIDVTELICGREIYMGVDEETWTYGQINAPRLLCADSDKVSIENVMVYEKVDDENPWYPHSWTPYEGVIRGGEAYEVGFNLTEKFGYGLTDSTVVRVNGIEVENDMAGWRFDMTAQHDWGTDGICVHCGEGLTEPAFATHSLMLSGRIGVQFFMNLACLTEEEKNASYMEFTVNGQTVRADFDDTNRDVRTGSYYGFTCYVNSVQMADTITAVFHYGDASVEATYSVAEYLGLFDANAHQFDERTQTLVKALADYGHYVQIYLSSENGWALGSDHKELFACYTDAYDLDAIKEAAAQYMPVKDIEGSGITNVSFKLGLSSATRLDLFLTPAQGVDVEASAQLSGATHTAVKADKGRWRVRVDGIPAHLLGEPIVTTGTALDSFSVTVSPMSYVWLVLESGYAGEHAKNAMAALYCYYDAAVSLREGL